MNDKEKRLLLDMYRKHAEILDESYDLNRGMAHVKWTGFVGMITMMMRGRISYLLGKHGAWVCIVDDLESILSEAGLKEECVRITREIKSDSERHCILKKPKWRVRTDDELI